MPPVDPADLMWAEACGMLERAERLRRDFFRPGPSGHRTPPSWEPPVDVFEMSDRIAVIVALPGVEPEDVTVAIDHDWVIITGTRALPRIDSGFVIHRLEIPHGRFERRIRLTTIAGLELQQRDLNRGCLLLIFRKLG